MFYRTPLLKDILGYTRWCFGLVILLFAWEITGNRGWLGSTWPPLSSIFDYLNSRPNLELLIRNAGVTGVNAVLGLLLGTLIGALLAILGWLIPRLYPGLSTFATFVNALPLIALGPLLIITVGEGATPVAIATLSVFFSFFVAAISGINQTTAIQRDVTTVFGASRWKQLRFVQLPAAVPRLFDGLKLGASAAVLGAILGEWFGSGRGLGVILVSAMQNFQIELLWSAALFGTLLTITGFVCISLIRFAFFRRYL